MTGPNDRELDVGLDAAADNGAHGSGARSADPSIERLLVDAFDHRAVRLGRGRPGLDVVLARVRRRRRRRRAVAALGSVVVLGGGVVGLGQLADDGDGRAALDGAVSEHEGIWSCTGALPAGDDGRARFESCVQLVDGPVPIDAVDATVTTVVENTTQPPAPSATTAATAPPTSVPESTVPGSTVPGIDVRELVVVSPTEQRYVVEPNDSLFSIGRLFDVDVQALVNYNAWPDDLDHVLDPDDVVLIPPGARVPTGEGQGGVLIYTVRAGDTASAIARTFGVSLAELAEVNEWSDDQLDDIRAGDEVVIPSSSPVAGS